MSSTRVTCPSCKAVSALPEVLRGKNVRCAACKTIFLVPGSSPVAKQEAREVLPIDEPIEAQPGELHGSLQTSPANGPPPRPRPTAGVPRRDNRMPVDEPEPEGLPLAWILGGVGALVLVGLAVGLTVWLPQPEDQPPPMVQVPHRPVFNERKGEWMPPVAVKPDPPIPTKKDPARFDPPFPRKEDPPRPGPAAPRKEDPPKPPEPPVLEPFDLGVVEALEIKPCPIKGDSEERSLPGTVSDMTLAGGGRLIILGMASLRKIAIFDVNEARVVKYLPMGESGAILAAGMDKLFVCLPEANVIQRWS